MKFGYVFLVAYWTVLVAELIGDKSIYAVASLSLRVRVRVMLMGMFLAFGGKMLVAVLAGQLLVRGHAVRCHAAPRPYTRSTLPCAIACR